MILFPTAEINKQFSSDLHPEVHDVIRGLDASLGSNTILRVTEVGRSDDDSERIYMEIAKRLTACEGKGLHGTDLSQFQQIQFLSPMGLKSWCRTRASWHKPLCAVDVGMTGMDDQTKNYVIQYLSNHCPRPMWELITEPHGTGPHAHVARRDYAWLKDFPGSLRSAQGRKKAP